MNTVQAVLAGITNDELQRMVLEMREYDETGILRDGHVRALAKRLVDEVGLPSSDAKNIAEREVIRMAAFKWAGAISPINTAPKDRDDILVNDTTSDAQQWVQAKWCEAPEWSGWVYADDILNDCKPLGPCPSHWLDAPMLTEK